MAAIVTGVLAWCCVPAFGQQAQTVTFAPLPPTLAHQPAALSAHASSELPVHFAIESGPAELNEDTNLVFLGFGLVSIVATQPGNEFWQPATPVTNTLRVFSLSENHGPLMGGLPVLLSGPGGIATNIILGNQTADLITAQVQHCSFTTPAQTQAGPCDLTVQYADSQITFSNAFLMNPAGQIGTTGTDWSNWEEIPGLPAPAEITFAGVINGKLHAYSNGHLFLYDGTNWSEGPSSPVPLYYGAGAFFSNRLMVMGGLVSTNAFIFDGTNWTETAGLPVPSFLNVGIGSHSGVVSLGGQYYGLITNAYLFDGQSWEPAPSITNPAISFSAASDGASAYVWGGFSGFWPFTQTVYCFSNHVWNVIGTFPIPVQGASGGFYDGYLYSISGFNLEGFMTTNIYRWESDHWTEQPGLPTARYSAGAAAYNGHLYAVGGSADYSLEYSTTNVFRYPAWRYMNLVSPSEGTSHGGDIVTIGGTHLGNGLDITNVTLCGAPVESILAQSPTQVVVRSGAGTPGTGEVRIDSIHFGSSVATQAFTYINFDRTVVHLNPGGPGSPPLITTNLVGSLITNTVPHAMAYGSTQYVCLGWQLQSPIVQSGAGNSMTMTLTDHAQITWNWKTQYWVEVVAHELYHLNEMSMWQDAGATTDLVARTFNFFQFQGWSINGVNMGDPILVTINHPITIAATYVPAMVTNTIVPLWWVDQYNLLNDPYQQVQQDQDGDGVATWSEFVAGSNPTNGQSQFLTQGELVISDSPGPSKLLNSEPGTVQIRFRWFSDIRRRYDLEKRVLTNNATWQPVPNFTNLPATPPQNEVLLSLDPQAMEPGALFRARVRLE